MLSRHSFNALLKTLEEPPSHVKFLLATTDPQKLPVTILSRCLQFHLKALDVDQIRQQLETVLTAEQITSDARALQLLARAADGSMRDALSLTDQAIAMGQGQVTAATVSQMLGTLDDEQPLAILEALVSADGEKVMAQVAQAASRGVDWENLLVETLALLHRIAMVQLLPSMLDNHYAAVEQRLRELARTLPPADVQLYYQTLLVGRKELAYAPDRRMGVEMTLLRALAFHPKAVIPEPVALVQTAPAPMAQPQQATSPQPPQFQDAPPPLGQPAASQRQSSTPLPDATAQLLKARSQLQRQQGASTPKKNEPAAPGIARPANSALGRLASVTERSQQRLAEKKVPEKPAKPEAYRWRAQTEPEAAPEPLATPKALRTALEHEKTPELAAKLVVESLERDAWAAEIDKLKIPKLVQQLALNAFKQQPEPGKINLHLRSSQRHLNSPSAQKTLAEALGELYGSPVELTVVEDDNPAERTPLEWRQAIYEEKLAQARQSIVADTHIQTLCRFFDADLDEESIRPL
jgi:DNA polymerase-3 subunit gamma/tau